MASSFIGTWSHIRLVVLCIELGPSAAVGAKRIVPCVLLLSLQVTLVCMCTRTHTHIYIYIHIIFIIIIIIIIIIIYTHVCMYVCKYAHARPPPRQQQIR